ncbi:3'-5' exonuclease (macronuclear) [Tetrahymena thermophila SB210]|uniref:3'-5' exonuclease n=1 Tax=Tetrahymena thermophila (strain SB210) TaxID=312017 RepID=Q23B12_TETTS|nr:3'-5' exonuclease [Tetrahymena thermophila SB210]EAR93672.2 3'-5' exonuclease [Tetrahymena thermophila SB210]|eukprot:XP_001013917.2 3'-5' exonuclease [Tetrahymena thermophila SB210]
MKPNNNIVANIFDCVKDLDQFNNYGKTFAQKVCKQKAKDLDAEQLIAQVNENFVQRFNGKQEDAFQLFLNIYDVFKRNQANHISYNIFMEGFIKYLVNKGDIQFLANLAKDNWKLIPGDVLERYLDFFQIKEAIPLEDIKQIVNYLIMIKKVNEALKVIGVFNVRNKLDMKEMIERMVNQDKINEALTIVNDEDIELQKHFVNQLIFKNYEDKCIEIIEKYNLNYKEFPQLVDRMEKKKVAKILQDCNQNWEKAEERINSQSQLLFYLVDLLVQKKKYQEAASIISRHQLNKIFQTQIDSLASHFELNQLLQDKSQNTMLNRILERDGFGPTEVLCFLEQEKYLTLEECGINQTDVYFIDQINQDFKIAVEILTKSKLIGFDSEFIPRWNKFEKGGIATLQLATNNKIFIFDTIKLLENEQFLDFVTYLFENENILKIGHSIWQDINEMDKTFKAKKEMKIKSFQDVGIIYKEALNLENVSSLKQMCYQILKQKISKYEQISDWSKRPLRKCQIHYAALDALLPLMLYEQINLMIENDSLKLLQSQSLDKNNLQYSSKTKYNEQPLQVGNFFKYSNRTENFFKNKQPKFIVDNMLYKLVKYLRNSGIDSTFLQDKNYKLICDLSNKEERIILTRNSKFFKQILCQAPVFLIQETTNTENQFKEILNFFKIQVDDGMILSRCIKCNGDKLEIISSEQAHKYVDFYNPNYSDFQFFQCASCKQVYWEGEKFKRSKERFNSIAQNVNQKLNSGSQQNEEISSQKD